MRNARKTLSDSLAGTNAIATTAKSNTLQGSRKKRVRLAAKRNAISASGPPCGFAVGGSTKWADFADEVSALLAAWKDEHAIVHPSIAREWDRYRKDPRTSEGQAWLRSTEGVRWLAENGWDGGSWV